MYTQNRIGRVSQMPRTHAQPSARHVPRQSRASTLTPLCTFSVQTRWHTHAPCRSQRRVHKTWSWTRMHAQRLRRTRGSQGGREGGGGGGQPGAAQTLCQSTQRRRSAAARAAHSAGDGSTSLCVMVSASGDSVEASTARPLRASITRQRSSAAATSAAEPS